MADDNKAGYKNLHKRWKLELDLYDKDFEKWAKRADKIGKRFRDERESRDSSKRFNILWSNVQTITPAIYAKTPKPEVSRRYTDDDPVGRTAATILERCLEYELENYNDYDSALVNCLQDRLLGGRGTAWIRYEPHMMAAPSPQITDDTVESDGNEPEAQEEIQTEQAPVDFVHRQDFRHSPARTWEEVRWVARDAYMTKDQLGKRFGQELAEAIPLSYKPQILKDRENEGGNKTVSAEGEELEKALIVEIWSKSDSTVTWICPDHDTALDHQPDPLMLEGFFPCPKPMYATLTNDSLIPVPDFTLYQDQAGELDDITARIHNLVKAVKVAGVYDATQKGIRELLSEGVENRLIPVDNWSSFSEKNGIAGTVDFMPLVEVVTALDKLYQDREATKQTIYEITGLSDIVRGASKASETATAQSIKSRFASLRIQMTQNDMARFATDLLRMKATIMCRHFQPETLVEMSNVMQTLDAQHVEAAIQLLKSAPMRAFRVEVNTDTMVELDANQEKAEKTEFLAAAGSFLQSALPIAQADKRMTPFLLELMNFGVRGYKAGRDVEAAFDQLKATMTEETPMPPEIAQAQEKLQMQQQQMQQEGQMLQQSKVALDQESQKLEVAKYEFGLSQKYAQAQAQMQAKSESESEALNREVLAYKAKGLQDVASGIGEHMGVLQQFSQQVGEALSQMAGTIAEVREQQAQEIGALAESIQQTQALLLKYATAKRTPVRGQSGRIEGVQIEGFEQGTLQ